MLNHHLRDPYVWLVLGKVTKRGLHHVGKYGGHCSDTSRKPNYLPLTANTYGGLIYTHGNFLLTYAHLSSRSIDTITLEKAFPWLFQANIPIF